MYRTSMQNSTRPRQLGLIVIGKTANGKSKAGNSILLYEKFRDSRQPNSATCNYLDCEVNVFNFPDIFDTQANREEQNRQFRNSMENALCVNKDGYHAFLVIVSFRNQFTQEETYFIESLKKNLGSDLLRNYGIVVATNCEPVQSFRGLNMVSLYKQQTGDVLNLILECQNRSVEFDICTSDENIRETQRAKLLELVIALNNDNKRYTKRHFKEAQMIMGSHKDTTSNNQVNTENCLENSPCLSKQSISTRTENKTRPVSRQNISAAQNSIDEHLEIIDIGEIKYNKAAMSPGLNLAEPFQGYNAFRSKQNAVTQRPIIMKPVVKQFIADKQISLDEPTQAVEIDKIKLAWNDITTTGHDTLQDKKESLASPDLDFIIIGKAGIGKSATGNSILRQHEEFKTNYNANPEVRNPQYRTTIIDGRNVQVVECPGVIDIDIDKRGGVESVVRAIQNAVLVNPQGYHAFLIVVAFGQRFYKQDLTCVRILKQILGENVIKNHGVIVMCQGDNFKYHEIKEKLTITKYCQKQEGAFKELLDECNKRIVVFDNSTKDANIQNMQLKNLVAIIDELKSSRHTTKTFEKAVELTKMLQKEKKMIIYQNLILQKLIEAKRNKNTLADIILLKDIIEELLNEIGRNCEQKKIFGLLKRNMDETRNYIEKCIVNVDLGSGDFFKIEREFKEIKRESDEGFFHKCLHHLEENDCYLIENYALNVFEELNG